MRHEVLWNGLRFEDHAPIDPICSHLRLRLPLRPPIGSRSAPHKHNRTNTDFKGAEIPNRADADSNIREHCMHAVLNHKSKLAYPLNSSSRRKESAIYPHCTLTDSQ